MMSLTLLRSSVNYGRLSTEIIVVTEGVEYVDLLLGSVILDLLW